MILRFSIFQFSFFIQNFPPENFGGVAQLGEHLPCKQGVRSSSLLVSIGAEREALSE